MEKRWSASDRLFFLAYGVWIVAGLLQITYYKEILPMSDLMDAAEKIVFLFCIGKLALDLPTDRRELLGLGALVAVWLLCCIGKRDAVMSVFLLVYSARTVNLKRILYLTLAIQLIMMLLTISAACLGLIENELWILEEQQRFRYALGYTYCTYPSHLLFFSTLLYICIRERIRVWEALGLTAVNYGMYLLTDTRTDLALAGVIIWLACLWCRRRGEVRRNVLSIVCIQCSFALACVGSILAQYFYDGSNALMTRLNLVLNGRLSLGHDAIEAYGVDLLGEYVRWVGQGTLKANPDSIYNYVDNAFLQLTINYGLLFMLLLCVLFCVCFGWAMRSGERALCLALLGATGFAMIDAELCVMAFDSVFVILSRAFLTPEQSMGALSNSPKSCMIERNVT